MVQRVSPMGIASQYPVDLNINRKSDISKEQLDQFFDIIEKIRDLAPIIVTQVNTIGK
jgi:hypothetical protein